MSGKGDGVPRRNLQHRSRNGSNNPNPPTGISQPILTDEGNDVDLFIQDLARATNNDDTRDSMLHAFQNLDAGLGLAFEKPNSTGISQNDLVIRATPSSDFKTSIESRTHAHARHFFPPYEATAHIPPSANLFLPGPGPMRSQNENPTTEDKSESSLSPRMSSDEISQPTAEQTKRKRNTAASARFREKKDRRSNWLNKL